MRYAFFSALIGIGCEQQLPGDPVGSYQVSATLEANSCGAAAVPAMDAFSFGVEIRRRDREAFWLRDDTPMVSGVFTGDDQYRFAFDATVELVASDLDLGIAGCVLAQHEVLRVTAMEAPMEGATPMDDEETMAAQTVPLHGEHSIDFAPLAGSDCAPALAISGGPFAALPCSVIYALEGEAVE